MECGIDIAEWAKSLEFEGAYDKKFLEVCPKLVPPTMRNTWRHIISHVLPIEKARSVRKHCLLYKLELEESIHKDIKLQARVKSLQEYESYVKINRLKIILSDLQVKIDTYGNEIKALRARLAPIGEKYKVEKEKEKEKLIKYKLIELKIKATKNETKKLEQLQSIMDFYLNAPKEIPYSQSSTEWQSKVIEYCNDLPEGQEINKLSEQLDTLLHTKLKFKTDDNLTIEMKNRLLQKMLFIHIKKFLEAKKYQENYEKLEKKNISLKQKCIKRVNEQYGKLPQEQLEGMLTSNIENIFEQSEATVLTNMGKSWNKTEFSHTDQYVRLKNEITKFNEQIKGKTSNISELMKGQDKLIKHCMEIQKVIKKEPKEAVEEIKASHKQLVQEIVNFNFLPTEVDLLLKISLPKRNNSSDDNSQNPAPIDGLLKIGKYALIVDELKFELPNIEIDAEMEIYSFKSNERTTEEKLKNCYKKLRETVLSIQKLKSSSLSHIEFWKQQPLAEGSRTSPDDYLKWRNRCKDAIRSLEIEVQEFDSLENDFTFSSSTGILSLHDED